MLLTRFYAPQEESPSEVWDKDNPDSVIRQLHIIHQTAVPQRQSGNAELYENTLKRLLIHMPRVYLQVNRSGKWILLNGKARLHTEIHAHNFLCQYRPTIVPHSSYLPELTSANIFPFPCLKGVIKSTRSLTFQMFDDICYLCFSRFQKWPSLTHSRRFIKSVVSVLCSTDITLKEIIVFLLLLFMLFFVMHPFTEISRRMFHV